MENLNLGIMALILGAVLLAIAILAIRKAGTRKTLGVIGVVVLVFGGVMYFAYPSMTFNLGTFAIGGDSAQAVPSSNGNGISIVTTNPTVSVTGRNSGNTGTTFAGGTTVKVGTGAFGTTNAVTTVVPGQTLDILVNASGYHSAVVKGLDVTPSTFPLTVDMNKNTSVTITAFNTNNQVMPSDNTQNQTVVAGQSPILDVKFNGGSQSNTQDMTCVLELSNKTAVDTTKGITMAGGVARTIPMNFYTLGGVGSYTAVYDIPALTDSSDVHHAITLNIATSTGATFANSNLKITCYTKENFVDTALGGALAYDIQDSSGTVKSMALYSRTLYLQA